VASGEVAGGSEVTISVPSGEAWVVSSYGNYDHHLKTYDGTNSPIISLSARDSNEETANLADRPVFTSDLEPSIRNPECSSQAYALSGREI